LETLYVARPHYKLEALVRGQILDANRAIFGRGDFKLRPTHLSLRITAETWEGLSENEKQKLVRKWFVVDPALKTVTSTN